MEQNQQALCDAEFYKKLPILPTLALFLEEVARLKEEGRSFTAKNYNKLYYSGIRPSTPGYRFPSDPLRVYAKEIEKLGIVPSWRAIYSNPPLPKDINVMSEERFTQEIRALGLNVTAYRLHRKYKTLPVYADVVFPSDPHFYYNRNRDPSLPKFSWPEDLLDPPELDLLPPHLSHKVYMTFSEAMELFNSPTFDKISPKKRAHYPLPPNPAEYYAAEYADEYSLTLFSLSDFREFLLSNEICNLADYLFDFTQTDTYYGVLPMDPEKVYGITWAEIIGTAPIPPAILE